MKDYMSLYKICRDELKRIGVDTSDNIEVKITKKTSVFGQYIRKNGMETIEISNSLLKDDIPDVAIKDTIIHELLHSVAPYDGHKGKWKMLANKVNASYPVYHIQRTGSKTDYGMKPDMFEYRYLIRCKKCGKLIGRQRWCDVVANPSRYSHAICGGGELELIKVPDGHVIWSCYNPKKRDA